MAKKGFKARRIERLCKADKLLTDIIEHAESIMNSTGLEDRIDMSDENYKAVKIREAALQVRALI